MTVPLNSISFTIERGLPMPPPRTKYPFLEMEVGDSFAAPLASRNIISSRASSIGARHGREFVSRKISDGQVRVWRVA